MTDFTLDKRLADSSISVMICDKFDVRLVDDKRYFWALLIPQIPHITELSDLSEQARLTLLSLTSHLSAGLKDSCKADKMNIAMIGNVVSQFHLHIVARHHTDDSWPDPIWGKGTPLRLTDEERQHRSHIIETLCASWLANR